MANPGETCDRCSNRPAVVRITEKNAGARAYCLPCAREVGAELFRGARVDPLEFWIALARPSPPVLPVPADAIPGATRCPHCGLTFAEFQTIGLAGCDHCYAVFSVVILPALAAIHSGRNP